MPELTAKQQAKLAQAIADDDDELVPEHRLDDAGNCSGCGHHLELHDEDGHDAEDQETETRAGCAADVPDLERDRCGCQRTQAWLRVDPRDAGKLRLAAARHARAESLRALGLQL